MSVEPIDGHKYFGSKPVAKKSELDMEAFVRLLTVQLSTQNPLEPMNDRDFFAQMAQLGQVQGMDKLRELSEIQQAQSLVGKTVTAVRPMTESSTGRDTLVTGKVENIVLKNGEYFLGIREQNGGLAEVRVQSIQSIEGGRPYADLSQYQGLIGRTAAGSGVATIETSVTEPDGDIRVVRETKDVTAVGKVIGVSQEDGKVTLQIRTAQYGVVPVALEDLQHLSE